MSLNWSRILAGLGISSALAGLWWYEALSDEEKKLANEKAESLAWQIFQKGLADLEPHQARSIHAMTHNHFN